MKAAHHIHAGVARPAVRCSVGRRRRGAGLPRFGHTGGACNGDGAARFSPPWTQPRGGRRHIHSNSAHSTNDGTWSGRADAVSPGAAAGERAERPPRRHHHRTRREAHRTRTTRCPAECRTRGATRRERSPSSLRDATPSPSRRARAPATPAASRCRGGRSAGEGRRPRPSTNGRAHLVTR